MLLVGEIANSTLFKLSLTELIKGSSVKASPGNKSFPEPKPLAPVPRKGGTKTHAPAPSWWTARARTGEVTPGFTKAEILKAAKDDPRAPGGAFERVGQLLSELLGEM